MYRHLFGPVPSRRLGMSLGVDVVPKKICSLDCVYCEVRRTTNLTIIRDEYIKYENIKNEIIDYFKVNLEPEYITFSGSGEPTLNTCIGDVINFIKEFKPNIPIAVLTNGTMLYSKNVRDAIKQADIVLPSLDAATENTFIKINQPSQELEIGKYVEGLIQFREEFNGKIWLEVFILPGYNDNIEDLNALKRAILKIKPDLVQLNTLDRPGNLKVLRSATLEELTNVIDIWRLNNVEIIAAPNKRKTLKVYKNNIETAILKTISRRPCTLEDLSEILAIHMTEINKYLDVLEAEGRIERVWQLRGTFYKIK